MMTASDDLLAEQSYLVARGVRPMAIVGTSPDDPETVQRVISRLKIIAAGSAIPFAIPASCRTELVVGYASHAWAVDLLRWAQTEAPDPHRHRIIGLLLGYNPDAIRCFEELGAGEASIWSGHPGQTGRHPHTLDTEEMYAPTAS